MKPILEVQDVSFSYGLGPIVLFEANLELSEGQITGLVGPNGSGKSTLINLIFDNYQLSKGSIKLMGRDHRSLEAKRAAVYLPSEDFLPDFLTGREYYKAVARMFGVAECSKEEIGQAFESLGMEGREDHLIEDYSHGMKKKIQFLTAFLLDRPLTVIDETFNGIDIDAQRYCSRRLLEMRERGRSVLLCTHDFALLEDIADEVVVMKKGIILELLAMDDLRNKDMNLRNVVDKMLFGNEHENV